MEKEWYVVNTYSGHEQKVKEKLEAKIESMGMQDYIYRIIIPETIEVEILDGCTTRISGNHSDYKINGMYANEYPLIDFVELPRSVAVELVMSVLLYLS